MERICIVKLTGEIVMVTFTHVSRNYQQPYYLKSYQLNHNDAFIDYGNDQWQWIVIGVVPKDSVDFS